MERQIPPGFKDKGKGGVDAANDYLVWEQTLIEAERRKTEALIVVTGDSSDEDWFRRDGGEIRGARVKYLKRLEGRRIQDCR